MNYLYLGVRDLYLPSAAAYMHIHNIKTMPSAQELLAYEYFRPVQMKDEGKLLWAGADAEQNDVYITSVGGHPEVFIRGIQSLLGICRLSLLEVKVVPCIFENPQISNIFRMLDWLGIRGTADRLALKVIFNRIGDLSPV